MSNTRLPAVPVPHQCPCCQSPQTKIKRVLAEGRFGSTSFICARRECALGVDLTKLETWVAD